MIISYDRFGKIPQSPEVQVRSQAFFDAYFALSKLKQCGCNASNTSNYLNCYEIWLIFVKSLL